MPLMSFRAFAKHSGRSRSTVAEAVASGRLDGALVERGGRRLIDSEKATALWQATTRAKADANGTTDGYREHRAARERAAAELTGLQADRARLALRREQRVVSGPSWQWVASLLADIESGLVNDAHQWVFTKFLPAASPEALAARAAEQVPDGSMTEVLAWLADQLTGRLRLTLEHASRQVERARDRQDEERSAFELEQGEQSVGRRLSPKRPRGRRDD